jgi:hypothetical protein
MHPLGEAVRALVPPPPPERGPTASRLTLRERLRDFPRRLLVYQGLRLGIEGALRGIDLAKSALKSSALAPWVLTRVDRWSPGIVERALRVDVQGDHTLQAYAESLEAIVRLGRASGTRILILLQPRSAYRELLDLLPGEGRERNLRALSAIRGGRPGEAVTLLEKERAARPGPAITRFNLAVAYRMAGRNADADRMMKSVITIRSFTLNVIAESTAARMGAPVVYIPLAFEASGAPDLFFPDRYHTRPQGNALVAAEVERTLQAPGWLPGRR